MKATAISKAEVSELPPPLGITSRAVAALVPRPGTLAATGLSADVLGDLASKLLLRSGVLSLSVLADRLAIPGSVLMEALSFLRKEGRIEVRPGSAAAPNVMPSTAILPPSWPLGLAGVSPHAYQA